MSNKFKKSRTAKAISGFVGLTTALLMMGGAAVGTASAQSVDDLTAQINSLLATISALQAQLATMQGGGTPATTGYTFTRNLTVGDTGEDVRQLQMVLNSNAATQVASSGVGSSGNETTYFGSLTKSAVVKFQNYYAAEVLTPVGLTSGTGYVGAFTRAKLEKVDIGEMGTEKDNALNTALPPEVAAAENQLKSGQTSGLGATSGALTVSKSISSANSGANNVISEVISQNKGVHVVFISAFSGPVGTLISLQGSGFTPNGNTVHFGQNLSIDGLNSGSGTDSIGFRIPLDFPLGRYDVWVSNANGAGKPNSIFFIITDPNVPKPVIASIAPGKASAGTRVVIQGSGFTATGNTINLGFALVNNAVSSDGTTLVFTMPVFTESPDTAEDIADTDPGLEITTLGQLRVDIPVAVFIENTNGVTGVSEMTLEYIPPIL